MARVYEMSITIKWDKKVAKRYPSLFLGLTVITGVKVQPRTPEQERYIEEIKKLLRSKHKVETLKDHPIVRAYRNFFWRLGIDPTKNRPASEALLRRILRGKGLPRVNNVVDAYNLASVETLVTMSAYDLSMVKPPLTVRFSREGEEVTLIGGRRRVLKGGELVLADKLGVLCVYVHGDVERAKVTWETRDVLLVGYGAPGIGEELVAKALEKACEYVTRFSGGEAKGVTILSPNLPINNSYSF